MTALTKEYERRKLVTQQKTDAVKNVKSQRTDILAGRSYKPGSGDAFVRSTPQPQKTVNVNVNNYNPVAEKSSKTAVRNLTNIAQLVNW